LLSLAVSADLDATPVCSVSSSGLAFGSFNTISGHVLDTVGSVTVSCTGNPGDSVSYQITFSRGNGSFGLRHMAAGNRTLRYNLFVDSSRLAVWGDGSSGTSAVNDTLTLSSTSGYRTYVVYGRIFSGQRQPNAQAYLDSVMVGLSY
jgi:spore coat protein U-like protein